MNIKRINCYNDNRFSQKVLYQHGCFLADGEPYEIEIISDYEAVVRGKNREAYPEVIEQFLFFTPHITTFYDGAHEQRRNIFTPKDLLLVSHVEYEEKWNQYCDDYFSNK